MSKSINHWYPRYTGDYAAKTADLSLLEHGVYAVLLDHYYSTAKPLDANAARLQRICKAFAEDEKEALQSVLDRFFIREPDGYHNVRADEELAKRLDISEKRRESALKRYDANAPANGGANAPAIAYTATATSTTTEEQQTVTATTTVLKIDKNIVEKPKTKKASADDHLEDFATFWQAYPRKDGKAEALRKWLIEIKDGMDKVKLAGCARLYGERCKKENREAKYILMPQTWLHQKRYEDEFVDYENEVALANEPDYTHEEWLLVAGLRQWKTDGTWPAFLGVRPDNLLCPAPKKLFDYVGLPYPVAQESPP